MNFTMEINMKFQKSRLYYAERLLFKTFYFLELNKYSK